MDIDLISIVVSIIFGLIGLGYGIRLLPYFEGRLKRGLLYLITLIALIMLVRIVVLIGQFYELGELMIVRSITTTVVIILITLTFSEWKKMVENLGKKKFR